VPNPRKATSISTVDRRTGIARVIGTAMNPTSRLRGTSSTAGGAVPLVGVPLVGVPPASHSPAPSDPASVPAASVPGASDPEGSSLTGWSASR